MAGSNSHGPGWLTTLLGAVVLVSAGFVFGLVVGVVSEEPELVVGHLAGQSEEVAWAAETTEESGDVLAALPDPPTPSPSAPPSGLAPMPEDEPLGLAAAAPAPDPRAAPEPRSPAKAERPTPSVSSPPPPRASFAVQVGAFNESGIAEDLAGELRVKGFPVYVTPGPADGRWRVRVGPVATKGEADTLASRLKQSERLPTWVLNEGGS